MKKIKVTLPMIKTMLEEEYDLLKQAQFNAALDRNYSEAFSYQVQQEFVTFLLHDVFTGNIWINPSDCAETTKLRKKHNGKN